MTADEVIAALKLQPHPKEGGFFVETYRSPQSLDLESLPAAYDGVRSMGTAIYYLLTPQTCSAMHRLPGDEVFHFYLGDPVEMLQLHPTGESEMIMLGTDLAGGQRPQVVVPGGTWQGSLLRPGGALALMGATMAPGFDYADYESGELKPLAEAYPQQRDAIAARIR